MELDFNLFASVILPVYNAGKYLNAAIESVLSQTFTNFELLLLDDGSTDGSLKQLEYYANLDSRCKVYSRANRGVAATLNEGLNLASSDIVIRMDQDDISRPERFEKQMRYMVEHPECVLIGSRAQLIDSEGLPIIVMGHCQTHEEIDAGLSWGGAFIFDPTIVVRKSAVLAVGGYRAEYEYAEDLDLFLRLAEVGRVANLPDVLVEYRQHPSSMSYARRDLQYQSILATTKDARRRRNLDMDEAEVAPQIAGMNVASSIPDVHRKWAWWALQGGNIATARKHAWRALSQDPLSLDNLKLCGCVIRGH
jgi:glycosyltransferase involved in cell wall biosynthesis